MQITKFKSDQVAVINVYRSHKGNSVELLKVLMGMVTPTVPVLITGDFNICLMNNGNNRMTKGLVESEFRQLMNEPTHIMGGHIDHVYWKDKTGIWMKPVLERYSPYYSDHDAACLTIRKN